MSEKCIDKLQPIGQIWPDMCFVNKVLLENVAMSICCLWHLSAPKTVVEKVQQSQQSQKYLLCRFCRRAC